MEENIVHSYRQLIVWQKAMELVVLVYHLTDRLPASEKYGLVSQMRRCAVSIPSNIAEGRRRSSRKDYAQFLMIAYGSGAELETQMEIVRRLSFLTSAVIAPVESLLDEVMRILNKMLLTLRSSP